MNDTLTMQQVADLARVERAVVSVWRTRYAASDDPFPSPQRPTGALTFEASDVAAWLTRTERGNNRDAGVDAALHSSRFAAVLARADDASRLLLLQSLIGEPLADLDRDAALDVIVDAAARPGITALLPAGPTLAALEDATLVADVDALVEAGYSGERVVWRMVAALRSGAAATDVAGDQGLGTILARTALTAGGASLLGTVVHALAPGRRLVVHGDGALAVAAQLASTAEADGAALFEGGLSFVDASGAPASEPSGGRAVVLRALAASGVDLDGGDNHLEGEQAGVLHFLVDPTATVHDAADVFARIRGLGHDLQPGDIALVVAPADLLVGDVTRTPEVSAARLDCFNIADATRAVARHKQAKKSGLAPDYTLPLRYVATLPKGLLSASGRRRLAVWALAPHDDAARRAFTRYGDHAAHALDAVECEALAADVAAACSDGRESHAYLRTRSQATLNLLDADSLVIAPGVREPRSGGDVLAAAWAHERASGGVSSGVELSSAGLVAARAPRAWGEIVTTYASVRRGHRVADVSTRSDVGAVVIGPDEVRGVRAVGSRRIDRLELERVAPQAKFTEPGDVVFTHVGGASAIVDARGGAVVQAPARILRAKPEGAGGTRLVPAQAVLDINAQPGSDTDAWRVHVTPYKQSACVDLIARSVASRRAELLTQLDALDAYESTVLTAIAQGVLLAEVSDAVHDGGPLK